MQQPSPRGSSFGALLLAVVAGAIGGAAGALIVQPQATAVGGADDPGLRQSIAALDESVRALGSQVGALGRTLHTPDTRPSEPLQLPDIGDPAAGNLVDVATVLGRLDDIAKLLQARAAATTSGFPGASPLPLLDTTRPATSPGALATMATEESDAVWRRHAFWTCQQVLDAYGLPTEVEAGDGTMGWYYQTADRTLHFRFFEGMLIDFWN